MREMEASKLAWTIEPILERIETSKVKVKVDSLVLLSRIACWRNRD